MSEYETMDDSLWRHLPQDIIKLILSLLPLKSLCRFKCVSPEWKSLISSPEFSKTRDRLTSKPPKALLISNCPHEADALYLVSLADANPTAENLDRFLPGHRRERHWHSPLCNGLLLRHGKSHDSIFLLNPFTREYRKLPEPPFPDINTSEGFDESVCGFGYDSCKDDYKVVIVKDAVAIYSLKTNAWSRTEVSDALALDAEFGVYLNDSLHWINWKDIPFVIAAFNFSDEMFRMIQLPPDDMCGDRHMVVLGGFLSLFIHPSIFSGIEVWMMKEYGVTESWTKIRIDNPLMDCAHAFFLTAEDGFVLRTSGIIVDDDGEIFAGERNEYQLVLYDPKQETLKVMIVPGIPTRFSFLGSSVETLISPNHGQVMRHCEASSRVIRTLDEASCSESFEKEESSELEISSDSDNTSAPITLDDMCSQSSEMEESYEVETSSDLDYTLASRTLDEARCSQSSEKGKKL